MTVLHNERSTPLSKNSANALATAINLAWDFTGIGALAEGAAWIYDGATNPTFVKSGTQTLSTVNGEPGRVPGVSGLYDYTNTTNYGMQVGTDDFTIAIRVNTAAALPTTSNSREIFRLAGSAGTTVSVSLIEYANVGWYISTTGSSAITLGAAQSAVSYPQNKTVIIWISKSAGVTTIYTQDAIAGTAPVARYLAGAVASTPLDSTRAARTIANFGGATTTTPALTAITRWTTALSTGDMQAVGVDFWNTETNTHSSDSIAITSPSSGSTIGATTVISGTYVGTAPSNIDAQFNGGAWVSGTPIAIGSGTWTAAFALTSGGPGNLIVRHTNNTSVVSSAVASVTVGTNALSFTDPGSPLTAAVPFRTFQKDAYNQATVRIAGVYTGSPSAIEYSWAGSTWATLVASPSGGVFDQTVTLTGPNQGPLLVRFSNDLSTQGAMQAVGVDDVFMVAGQSNHVGGGAGTYVPASAPLSHSGWKPSIYDKTGRWRENVETATDPFSLTTNASIYPAASAVYPVQASSPTAYNSYFGQLATNCMAVGRTPAFVPSSQGSTFISAWAASTSTGTLYGAMLAAAQTIGAKHVLWWQGEADGSYGTTRATYEAALNAMINDWCSRVPGAKWVLMNVNATGISVGSGGTGPSDDGFNATHAAIANVAATNPNVAGIADMNGAFSGSVHYAAQSEITEVALRAFGAVKTAFFDAPGGTGTSTGSGSGGDAVGNSAGDAAASGGTGTSTGSGSGGSATGVTSATVGAATGTSTGSGSGGDATAGSGSSASIPSATGTSAGSGSGGSATGAGSGTYTRAPSGSGPSLIYPTSSRGIKPGRCRH